MPSGRGFRHTLAVLGLCATCLLWGGSFSAMKVCLGQGLSVGAMLSLRFTTGALVLGLLLLARRVPVKRSELKDGVLLGLVLTAIFWLQADGLRFTSTSKSGFITGLYVIFTPLAALLWRERLRASHALGILLACGGLYLLVHDPGKPMGGWNWGDSETLVCAVACGFHIAMTSHFARRSSGWVLAFGQVAVVALLSLLLTPMVSSAPLPDGSRLGGFLGTAAALHRTDVLVAFLFQALLATSLAFWVQSTAQRYVGPTEAALLYVLEPVFTALIAVLGLVPGVKEHLGPAQWMGAGLIVGAMLVAELGPRLFREPEEALS